MFIRNLLVFLMLFGFALTANATRLGKTQHHFKSSSVTQAIAEHTININTANAAQFATIKGLGVKKAEAIVAYRKANGKFQTVENLMKVKGIGEKKLAKIRQHLTV